MACWAVTRVVQGGGLTQEGHVDGAGFPRTQDGHGGDDAQRALRTDEQLLEVISCVVLPQSGQTVQHPAVCQHLERRRERDTETHTARETDRQTDRETERQRDRETERQRDRETDRQRQRQRQRDRETERQNGWCFPRVARCFWGPV